MEKTKQLPSHWKLLVRGCKHLMFEYREEYNLIWLDDVCYRATNSQVCEVLDYWESPAYSNNRMLSDVPVGNTPKSKYTPEEFKSLWEGQWTSNTPKTASADQSWSGKRVGDKYYDSYDQVVQSSFREDVDDEVRKVKTGFDWGPLIRSVGITCRYCGAEGLRWENINGKWRLFDGDVMHRCPKSSLKRKFNFEV